MDSATTPDVRSGELAEYGETNAMEFLTALLEGNPGDAAVITAQSFVDNGLPGLFALCSHLAAMCIPGGGRVVDFTVFRQTQEGPEPLDINDAPRVYATAARFIATINAIDMDTAWALFLTMFPWGQVPGTREQSRFVLTIGQVLTSSLEFGEMWGELGWEPGGLRES